MEKRKKKKTEEKVKEKTKKIGENEGYVHVFIRCHVIIRAELLVHVSQEKRSLANTCISQEGHFDVNKVAYS